VLQISDRTLQQYYRQNFRDRIYHFLRQINWSARAPGKKKSLGAGAGATSNNLSRTLFRPHQRDSAIKYNILLAALINHPSIFDAVEEHLAQISMPQERLDFIRQSVLDLLGENPDLDKDALCNNLIERGFEEDLIGILSDSSYIHAGFARPQANAVEALDGWLEIFQFLKSSGVKRKSVEI
jgi:DNA primase